MANVSDYVFQNMSRIGMDQCYTQQRDVENTNFSTYMLQNYFASDCRMMKPIELATSQPGIVYSGGYGSGAGGCNINDSSKILIGTINTHPRCRISLLERPFATVPFLGRGSVDAAMESQIQQGEQITNKKSVSNLGDISQFQYHQRPLAPVSEERLDGYYSALGAVPRGGINSKDQYRDTARYGNK